MKHRLEKWTVRWTENWLNCRARKVVVSVMKSSWKPVANGVPRYQHWGQQFKINTFINEQDIANLQTIQNWEEWLMHQTVVLPCINRLEERGNRNFMKFISGKCKALHLRNNSRHPDSLGANWLKSSLAEKTWKSWWVRS